MNLLDKSAINAEKNRKRFDFGIITVGKFKTIDMKKSSIGWLFAVIILSVLLVLSLILGFSGFFFSVSYLNSNSELTVGDNFSIAVKPNEASVASFTFGGAYLPGERIPQVVQINAQNLNSDVKVRVKAKIFGVDDDTEFDFVTSEHFDRAEDGYFYYDDVLLGGNKITFCTDIIVPSDSNLVGKEKYILTFVVETLETQFDVDEIWNIA